ncbi:MAG: (2Fe-2S)-binding protein [Verrucomicrobiae bacterium]|nr:(2Fe-2S)-binding protein [Verrucomicrobiae bacterium]MCP5518625.1 (2Fe-2S)-binding protein [Verrucomicrobiales bacterium]MCP5528355.1 (2Fe-2S)-binding protein [Verrucomicrobiales bacterium]
MPRVVILPVELVGEIGAGESLLDAGGNAGVEMEAGCFDCSCGTCAVAVVHGMENLLPPTLDELAVLAAWNRDPARYRLACCARVCQGDVTIRQLD